MNKRLHAALRWVGIAALVAAAAGAAVGAGLIFLGRYNVAATEPHWDITVWLLERAMRSSVRARAGDETPPPAALEHRVAEGATIFRAHCVACHGAPGVAPQPFALGMVPLPANLAYTARTWPGEQLFWVIKHGVKMSGMPAWSYRLSDDQIWAVVAFLPAMAHMTPAQYAALQTPPAPSHEASAIGPPDAERGRRAMRQYACITCHRIPGVDGVPAPVGPPLAGMGRREFIAGVLPNTREHMVRWLRAPQQVAPRSAMPDLGVSERDAADMAAYLATLR